MSYLTDRLRAFDPGSRFAPRDAAATNTAEAAETTAREITPAKLALDADMLDVVDKFEAAFSELVPAAAAPERDPERAANIDIDFMDEELRKAFGDDERSHESPATRADRRPFDSPAPAVTRAAPREDKGQDLSFEDAMATLRASEARGKAAAGAVDRTEKHQSSLRIERQPQRQAPESRQSASHFSQDASPAEPLAANDSWTTRSRKVWPKVAGAAALALFIGTGVGYLAGKKPVGGAPAASIATTPEGGARLRFDYDLNQR